MGGGRGAAKEAPEEGGTGDWNARSPAPLAPLVLPWAVLSPEGNLILRFAPGRGMDEEVYCPRASLFYVN